MAATDYMISEAEQAEHHARLLTAFAKIKRAAVADPYDERIPGWRDGLLLMVEGYRDEWGEDPDFGSY